jgi:hypothetical protein
VIVVLLVGVLVWATRDTGPTPGAGMGTIVGRLVQHESLPRDLQPYAGLGTWVDGFDFGPAYAGSSSPPVAPSAVDDMAAGGVKTLYLQAVRDDKRSPDGLVDRALIGEFLIRAHRHGMRVVGWYLPKFVDIDADARHLQQIEQFQVLGHRFDGVAVDIEATEDQPDVEARNAALVTLSDRVHASMGGDALGAIVLPPVLTEVVNENYWPEFPWREVRDFYDVWLPMSYWTFRLTSSGYHDGYTYNDESTRRLRNNLDDQRAVVHAIGGIGDEITPDEIGRFAQSLVDDGAVGGSIYDWNAMTPATRALVSEAFATGAAAHLPSP